MSRLLLLCCCLMASFARAKPWNTIAPGISTKEEVFEKFGVPTKRTENEAADMVTWVYARDQAINGTTQAQFRIDAKTKIVMRIDVYPAPIIDVAAIEKTYGPDCKVDPSKNCYVKRQAPSKHAYFTYPMLGLAIFFKDDDKTVKSFTFIPTPEKERATGKAEDADPP